MKGSIAQCVEEFVRRNYGHAAWDDVCERIGLAANTRFNELDVLESARVDEILAAVAELRDLRPSQVAYGLGRYWVCYYAPRHYPECFRGVGTALEFLLEMKSVYEVMTRSLTNARMPRFVFRWTETGGLVIEFTPERSLIELLGGIVAGVGERFAEQLDVSTTPNTFTIEFAAVAERRAASA